MLCMAKGKGDVTYPGEGCEEADDGKRKSLQDDEATF
jgi:hypothetical protein